MTGFWGVVEQTDPLRVRRDIEGSVAPDVEPASLVAGLMVGDKVWVQQVGSQRIVIGKKQ